MTDVHHPAVPDPDPHLLARGHDLTARVRAVIADLSAWCDEVTAARVHQLLDAEAQSSAAFLHLEEALVAISSFTLIAATAGPT